MKNKDKLKTLGKKPPVDFDYIEIDTEKLIKQAKKAAEVGLIIIGAAGLITAGLVAPGLANALGKMYVRHNKKEIAQKYRRDTGFLRTRNHIQYLRREGYLKVKKSNKEIFYELSEKGKKYLRKLAILSQEIPKPKNWSHTWWVVMADIPTKSHRISAELFRVRIRQIGFYQLQRSVWVYPYNPTSSLNALTKYYDLGKFVTILEAKRFDQEDEAKLKTFFKL